MARRNDLDALRGTFLLLMAAVHLPTALSPYANEPFGYASAATGFVFLSGFLVGSIYTPLMVQRGLEYVRGRLLHRARTLYGYHLLLLALIFGAAVAAVRWFSSASLYDYLEVFFRHPIWALASSPLLIYKPPLLDILPMYIVFLVLTPAILSAGERFGWWTILSGSVVVWLFAQLHGARLLYGWVSGAGVPLPLDAFGAFNWFGWQLVWVSGVWIGAGQHRWASADLRWTRAPLVLASAAAIVVVFLIWRHHAAVLSVQVTDRSALVDKWKLGPLRILDAVALGLVLTPTLLPLLRRARVKLLELLGRNSLQVFAAHIPVCVLADALIGPPRAHGPSALDQVLIVALMVGVMFVVAWRSDARRRSGRRSARLRLQDSSGVTERGSRCVSR